MACNLAIALAEAGWRVLLVDADLRRPKVADYLGLDGGVGLTDVLVGDVQVGDVVQRWGDKSLLVLPSGVDPAEPERTARFARRWRTCCCTPARPLDIVVIDTAPLLAVTDGVVVAVQADGALLVTQQGRTSARQAAAAARSLHSVVGRGCSAACSTWPRCHARTPTSTRRTGSPPGRAVGARRPATAARRGERRGRAASATGRRNSPGCPDERSDGSSSRARSLGAAPEVDGVPPIGSAVVRVGGGGLQPPPGVGRRDRARAAGRRADGRPRRPAGRTGAA